MTEIRLVSRFAGDQRCTLNFSGLRILRIGVPRHSSKISRLRSRVSIDIADGRKKEFELQSAREISTLTSKSDMQIEFHWAPNCARSRLARKPRWLRWRIKSPRDLIVPFSVIPTDNGIHGYSVISRCMMQVTVRRLKSAKHAS